MADGCIYSKRDDVRADEELEKKDERRLYPSTACIYMLFYLHNY